MINNRKLALCLFLVAILDFLVSCNNILKSGDATTINIDKSGNILDYVGKNPATPPLMIEYGGKQIVNKPSEVSQNEGDEAVFKYVFQTHPAIKVNLTYKLSLILGDILLQRDVEITADSSITDDLTVQIPILAGGCENVWLPMFDGTGKIFKSSELKAAYRMAGVTPEYRQRLSIPLVDFESGGLAKNCAVITDVEFTTSFTGETISWTYPQEVGFTDNPERRTIFNIFHKGKSEDALNLFYKTALKDIPPGPQWLHNIAMISYDYMSDEGKGWYNDIDALVKVISPEDSSKVCLTLHGWYDFVGRYCFDEKSQKLVSEWNSFKKDVGRITLEDIHNRIRYAKSRGFRVAMYFADGTLTGDGLDNFNSENTFTGKGWQSDDVKGITRRQNPLSPCVSNFYMGYAKALATEFGNEVDAFVWDETFYIDADNYGTSYFPGYMSRKFIRLVKDVAKIFHKVNPNIAFLTSDCIGPNQSWFYVSFENVPPYSLYADGIYQDSHCIPDFWSYAIFPNYRNTVWSCCWEDIQNWGFIAFAADNYQSPVVFTNGWGDNTGFSKMSNEQKGRLLDLFNRRKQFRTKLKWFDKLPIYKK